MTLADDMTKWGVVGFSEALRRECLHIGVRVTCVEPGFVDTELQMPAGRHATAAPYFS